MISITATTEITAEDIDAAARRILAEERKPAGDRWYAKIPIPTPKEALCH